MLIETKNANLELKDLLDDLDLHPREKSFGDDIDLANKEIFHLSSSADESCISFLNWVARYQSCLFGRMGARGAKGINYNICWITSTDINEGDNHLREKIQQARRDWKDLASEGLSSGFLIMLNDVRLVLAKPGFEFLEVCKRICELYLIEHTPIESDVIYTEAIPLGSDDSLGIFKAGVNIFYSSAHSTLNHDRRVPGGVLLSTNSPGHLANSLVIKDKSLTLNSAVDQIFNLAMQSIGNGGIGHKAIESCTWHNRETEQDKLKERKALRPHPKHVPVDYSDTIYSALYHPDVLLPEVVMTNDTECPKLKHAEKWPWLAIDYITEERFESGHVNYGLFNAHSIPKEAKYHNPWPPRKAVNNRLFEY